MDSGAAVEGRPLRLGARMKPTQAGWRIDSSRRIQARIAEGVARTVLAACGWFSVATMVGIILVLVIESLHFFENVSVVEFLTGTEWTPLFEPAHFGILPLVCGTLLIGLAAGFVAIPLGTLSAVFLSEIAPKGLRAWLKPTLELLAGVPSVVYGYLALTLVTPFLQKVIPSTQIFNAASAGIAVGVMTLPLVASLCDDALRAVPRSLREAGAALGATRFEIVRGVVIPWALPGMFAAYILAIARAIGESMAVAMAAGATPRMSLNPLQGIQTLTGYIVQVSLGDTPAGTIAGQSVFAVALVLFSVTLMMNAVSSFVLRRVMARRG